MEGTDEIQTLTVVSERTLSAVLISRKTFKISMLMTYEMLKKEFSIKGRQAAFTPRKASISARSDSDHSGVVFVGTLLERLAL